METEVKAESESKPDLIKELTPAQELLMSTVCEKYENIVLLGDDSHDLDKINKGIAFIYGLTELPPPEVIVCNSPWAMAKEANLKKGETFDNFGCGYDSGWTAFYDYMQQIGVAYNDIEFDKWKEFITESGVFATVLYEHVAYVCIRPCSVFRNAAGNLHCETGPAISWRDGYCEYYLNGVSVTEAIVMTPAEKLDATLVLSEKNAEVRRELVRKIGIEIICQRLNAKVIEEGVDQVGQPCQLLNLDLGDGRFRPYIKLLNPSIQTYHIEGVSPECDTLEKAFLFRNGTSDKPTILT